MASFFPKALVFKEWRQQRLWGLLLFLFMGAPITLVFMTQIANMWSQSQSEEILRQNLRNSLLAALGHPPNYYSGSLFQMFFFGVAVFGSTIVAYDRSQGGLWYTLSGPFTRGQVLRVKVAIGGLFLLGIITVYVLMLALFNAIGQTDVGAYWFLRWYGYELLLQLAVFMCAVIGANLVGNVVVAPMAGLGVAGVLGAVSMYLKFLVQNTSYGHSINSYDRPLQAVAHFIVQWSPLYYINYNSGINFNLFIPCTLVWIGLGYVVAQRCFHSLAVERMADFFSFSVLWKWLIFGVAFLIGLMFSAASSRDYNTSTGLFLIKHAIFTAVCWFVLIWVIRLYRKKFMEA